MKKEIWRDIKDYEGLYQISNKGRVKRLENRVHKIIKGKECYPLYKEQILKISNHNKNGYLKINISKSNIEKTYQIHRLVAETFISNPDNKPQVNHKNGIKTDNQVENLEWVTESENHKHAFMIRIKKPNYKKVIQYDKNNQIIKEWNSAKEASKETGICYTTICDCCRHRKNVNTAGGYKWDYILPEELKKSRWVGV